MSRYRKFYFDIEVLTKEKNVFPEPSIEECPVVSFSSYDNITQQYIDVAQREDLKRVRRTQKNRTTLFVSSENELFDIFSKVVKSYDPDILTGWFVDFDMLYMINRSINIDFDLRPISPLEELNTKSRKQYVDYVPGRMVFDLAKGYRAIKNPLGSSLKDVAKMENVSQKVGSPLSVPEWYHNDINSLIEYNYGDVVACKEIDEKHDIIGYYIGLKEFAGLQDLSDVWFFSVGLDTLLLRLARESDVVLPSKSNEKGEWYKGGTVFGPKVGLHPMVGLFDFAKFYPSIIKSLNLSPEMVDPNGEIDCGEFRTRKRPMGIVPRLYMICAEQRTEIEAELAKYEPGTEEYNVLYQKRQIVKDYSNAVHGMLAYKRSRVHHFPIAKKITEVSRKGIDFARNAFSELDHEPIYGDTDSVFIQLSEDPNDDPFTLAKDAKRLSDNVTRQLLSFAKDNFGIDSHEFSIDFDKLFQRIVFIPIGGGTRGARKRYGGWVIFDKGRKDGYLYMVGLEYKRRDIAPTTRELQERVVRDITTGVDPEITVEYVKNVIKKVRNPDTPLDDISIRKTLGHPISSYGGTNIHGNKKGIPDFAKGAIYSNKHLGTRFDHGSMVKMLYIKHVYGLPKTEVICYDDSDQLPEVIVDREKFVDRIVKKKVQRILAMAEIPWSLIDGTGSLDKWLKGGN